MQQYYEQTQPSEDETRRFCTVKALATKKTMDEYGAFQKARSGGNALGKALYGSGNITMREMYLQSFEVIFDAYYRPSLTQRMFSRSRGQLNGNSQKICMIVEGTRCSASYYEGPLKLSPMELDKEDCQDSTFTEEQVIARAKRTAMRIMRRHGNRVVVSMELASIRPFYRPYYVAFYGELEMGKKVRYIAIEADGFKTDNSL